MQFNVINEHCCCAHAKLKTVTCIHTEYTRNRQRAEPTKRALDSEKKRVLSSNKKMSKKSSHRFIAATLNKFSNSMNQMEMRTAINFHCTHTLTAHVECIWRNDFSFELRAFLTASLLFFLVSLSSCTWPLCLFLFFSYSNFTTLFMTQLCIGKFSHFVSAVSVDTVPEYTIREFNRCSYDSHIRSSSFAASHEDSV